MLVLILVCTKFPYTVQGSHNMTFLNQLIFMLRLQPILIPWCLDLIYNIFKIHAIAWLICYCCKPKHQRTVCARTVQCFVIQKHYKNVFVSFRGLHRITGIFSHVNIFKSELGALSRNDKLGFQGATIYQSSIFITVMLFFVICS